MSDTASTGATGATAATAPASVAFFFDPMCPYAYQTSLWIREVRARTGLAIEWRFFSLEEINRVEGKKHPWERPWSFGWSQMRIGAWLRREGQDVVDRWYLAVGGAFHVDGRVTHDPAVHREVLAEIGIDPGVVDAAIADPTTTDEVRADHERSVRELGAFGVPTLCFPDGRAVFGPMAVPAPMGDDADRLWDLTLAFASFPHLYELRLPKDAGELGHIARTFEPYLRARSWKTIENPAP